MYHFFVLYICLLVTNLIYPLLPLPEAWSLSEADSLDALDALEFNSKHGPYAHLHHHHLMDRELPYSHVYSSPMDLRTGYPRGLTNGGGTLRRERNRSSSGTTLCYIYRQILCKLLKTLDPTKMRSLHPQFFSIKMLLL